MKSGTSTKLKSILGISLTRDQMHGIVASRNGKGFQVQKDFHQELSFDPLAADPILLGQSIRNALDEAGIREKQCVICIPTQWILSYQIELPDLSGDDLDDYIKLHSEREFPYPPSELSISLSRYRSVEGKEYATVAAVPLSYLKIIETAMQSIGRKLVSITTAYPPGRDSDPHHGMIVCQKSAAGIDCYVQTGGGIASMRSIAIDSDEQTGSMEQEARHLLREIRITLGQLTEEFRSSIREVRLTGPAQWIESMTDIMSAPLDTLGLDVRAGMSSLSDAGFPGQRSWNGYSPILGALSRILYDTSTVFEFLPPRVSTVQAFIAKWLNQGSVSWGSAAAAVILVAASIFLYQSYRLSCLESEWDAMADRVTEVEAIQEQVKQFRPWFDTSVPSLTILQILTEAFPEEGSIWAQSIEVENNVNVSCSGFAQDNQALLEVMDRLNENEQVQDLQIRQTEGESPLQFTFYFVVTKG